jgi:hypothetical protein
MSRPVVIRPAIVDDAQGVLKTHSAAVHRTAARRYASDILTAWAAPLDADNVRRMAGIIASQSELVLVAEIGAKIAGFDQSCRKTVSFARSTFTQILGANALAAESWRRWKT